MGWDIQRKAPNRTRQKTRGKEERTEQTPSCDLDHPHYWQPEEFHQTATDYRKETNGNFRIKNYSNSQIEGHCTTDLTKISQNLSRSQNKKKTKDTINWHEQVSEARRQRGQGQQSRTLLQKQSGDITYCWSTCSACIQTRLDPEHFFCFFFLSILAFRDVL